MHHLPKGYSCTDEGVKKFCADNRDHAMCKDSVRCQGAAPGKVKMACPSKFACKISKPGSPLPDPICFEVGTRKETTDCANQVKQEHKFTANFDKTTKKFEGKGDVAKARCSSEIQRKLDAIADAAGVPQPPNGSLDSATIKRYKWKTKEERTWWDVPGISTFTGGSLWRDQKWRVVGLSNACLDLQKYLQKEGKVCADTFTVGNAAKEDSNDKMSSCHQLPKINGDTGDCRRNEKDNAKIEAENEDALKICECSDSDSCNDFRGVIAYSRHLRGIAGEAKYLKRNGTEFKFEEPTVK